MKTTPPDPSLVQAYLLALNSVPAAEWPPQLLKALQSLQATFVKWDCSAVL